MALFNLGRKSVPAPQPEKSDIEKLLERATKAGMQHQAAQVIRKEVDSKEYRNLVEEKAEVWKMMRKRQEQTSENIAAGRKIRKDASELGYSPQHLSDKDDVLAEELNQLFEDMTAFGL